MCWWGTRLLLLQRMFHSSVSFPCALVVVLSQNVVSAEVSNTQSNVIGILPLLIWDQYFYLVSNNTPKEELLLLKYLSEESIFAFY